MSITTVELLVSRIKSATEESPIAVFCVKNENKKRYEIYKRYQLNSVFANTFKTRKAIADADESLIGLFHCKDNPDNVRALLNSVMRNGVSNELCKAV